VVPKAGSRGPAGRVELPYGARAGIGAHSLMDTSTLNYAIGAVVLAGALAIGLAILVW